MKNPAGLDEIKKMIAANEHRFKMGGTTNFVSNIPSLSNASHILPYDSTKLGWAQRGATHILWESNSVITAQAIRKLFPRPNFLPTTAEVSLIKRIYIDGPLSGRYEMVRKSN